MNDLELILTVAVFCLLTILLCTVLYCREEVRYAGERWRGAEDYTAYLQRVYRGELMLSEEAEAEAEEADKE